MLKQVIYRYLGTNGIIESPVHLEDTYYIRLIQLTVRVPEDDVDLWTEVIDDQVE